MAPLLDPDKQRRAYDRSCSSLNTTPKKTLFWLLLSLHILSCLSQKSNSDQIHEIFHDDLEHSIVRRDVSSDGGSQAQEVSKLALATRLNSSHLHLMVHWAGQGSPVIFVLARSQVMDSKANSKVYISRDYGKTFHEKSELFQVSTNAEDGKTSTNAVIAKFYHHPQSNCHYVFADTVNRYIFTTTDCGETIQARNLDTIHPSLIAFDKNNENVFLIHDLESPEKRLHVTRTFGQTFDQVQDYVRNFFFSKVDLGSKLFIERIQPLEEGQTEKDRRVTILAADNFFERKIDVEVVYRNAVQFQLLGDFMFVTKYRNEDDKEHMDLFISVHGERFVQARFPFSESKNFTHLDYHIIDVTDEGQIMVIVNHGPVISHLYTSTRMTPYEAEFSLSLERVMFYNPNVTWHDSWLAATAGDEPFADVYKIQGLRGIYVASQIVNTNEDSRMIEPKNLQTKISFDQGAVWIPIKGPKTDEEGRDFTDCLDADYRCNLHLSQQLSSKFPITRSIPILTSKNAIGIVMASGNMGQTLTQKNNVFVSADAGLSWHQVLKGSYFYNLGDHGGIIVAVKYFKTEGPTNELLYSTDEGLNWKSLKFYDKPLRVYGLLTEPGENTTAFTVFGTEHGVQGVDWIIVTIDLKSVFERECTVEDYKRWSPNDNTKGKHRYCLLGRKEIYERRMVKSNCYNGRDYERLISVENCLCQMNDFQCDFGFKRDSSWSNGCVLDENYHHQPYEPPARCPPGEFYNLTRGYIKIRGDSCEAGKSKVFEPQSVPCPIKEEKEFLLLSLRDRVMRINLRNFTEQEELPLENVKNVISLEYDLQDGCIFYGDTTDRKIYKQCLNGSMVETLVQKTDTVEGMSYDWISKTLYFVDGAQKTIELVRVDVKNEGHMRKTILDQQTLRKPRGLAVHPLHGYLFYSDWNEESPHIGRADMDGSNALVLFKSPIVQWPNGLSLDYVANRLYWTDAKKDMIASCLFDGSDFKIVVQNSHSLEHPFGMTVHKNLVFWDDWTHHALFLADKNTGKGSASIMTNIKGGMDVKAFSSLHRHGQNNCSSHSCSHICVPLPDDKSVCLCPDGLKAVQEEGQVSCKCPDGSDSLGNGTCAEQQNGSCMPHQYTCGNGICIPETWVCDGNNDCGDHSDEADHKCLKLQCRDTEFMCQDGSKCVPEKWKCDFDKDCPDGSDENCTHSTCAPDQFRCHNGQCISNKWQCDLEEDCTDGSDELNCTGNPDAKCKPNEFQCENSPQCFPESWKCDGDFDCPGQEDEKDCQEHKCEDWQFDCGNGQCIFKSWTCDGDKDCPSGADEANCTSAEDETNSETLFPAPFFPNATQCNEWTFRCNNGQCIPYWWKCDGTEDCSDKSDELECQDESEKDDDDHHNDDEDYDNEHNDPTWQPKCSEDKFLCPGSNDCIWEAWLCDHENDCPGGEDEAEEICANRPVCSREMFRCEKSGDCISYEQICDQKVDCSDGSDEIGCHDSEPNEHNCGPNEFPCDENNCVSDSQICDGISQCLDGTDELVCNNDHPQVLGLEVMEDTVNATSVQLDWYVPDMAHAGDYEYQPGFAPHGTEEWHWHAWQKIPETTWKFQHLRPFTTYKFRVNLRSNGIVYNGTSLAQTTTSPAIPSAPRITNVEQTNAGLVLSWTKPGATNGALKNYIIEISANESSIETVETEGPVQSYTLDTQQFNAGQKVTFRVRAVNSHFKGDFSDPKDLEIGHEILQDAISQLKIVSTADSFVTFQWSKLVPAQAESSPLFGQSWFYRVSYSILDNQFANYPDLNVTNDKESLNVTNLSPGSAYTFRFNIQLGSLSGPSVLKHVQTLGKALPRPQISKANLAPTAGTSIKLTWNKAKGQEWTYAVFYGRNIEEMITEGVRQTTTDTSLQIDRLHACESYTFVVAINGPKGMGPPSPPFSKSTKFSPGAPPKNLQATVDRTSNVIRITWNASCSVINDAIGYQLGITDKTTGSTSYVNLMRTQNTSLTHVFDKNVKYGTAYQFTVQTDDPNAQKSPKYTVKTLPIPVPAGLTTFLNVNASTHEIAWNIPNKLPSYLQKKVNAQKIQYRLFVSTDHDFKDLTLVANLSETRYKLPKDRLEPGKIYYVGVSLVDGAYVSEKAGPIPLEATIPAHDLIVSPSGMAGVLVPIFIVIAVLGSVLAYYAHRHRRLKRNFAAFASRYSPATGAAILNAASLDDDDDDSPIIRGFADDEPLVVS